MAKKPSEDAVNKPKVIYTITLEESQIQALETWCDHRAWEFYHVDYARFAFRGDGVNVVAYQSGKVVIQGKKTESFVTYVLESEITRKPQWGLERVHHPEWFVPHAGMDESGKGDFFGPLVTACVIADGPMVDAWIQSGLRESKRLGNDLTVFKMEQLVRRTQGVVIEIAFAGMEKYNSLYGQFGNLNELLAWLHAKSLDNALKKHWVPEGLLDQFAKGKLVQKYLENTQFNLKQRVRAEEDPVVAAASVVARAEYLRQLKKLSDEAGMPLPKGAGARVQEIAHTLVKNLGRERLGCFAKLHFKTTDKIVNDS
ncbi:MAG: ribonuclease HIII [Puniceicoccales bacterium]|jgi:ribonuclease HIII|nr:ribonuclease HIII [Puniceicoccales bacterium]